MSSNSNKNSGQNNLLYGTLFAAAAGVGVALYSYYNSNKEEEKPHCSARDQNYTYSFASAADTHPKQAEDGKRDDAKVLEKCAICMSELIPRTSTFSVLPCGHTYHENCVQKWLRENKWCPICRLALRE